MGIVTLASVLKSRGLKVSVFDCQLRRDFADGLVKAAETDRKVGFYTTTYSYHFVREMAKNIKAAYRDAQIILGGPHASHKPQELVEDFADIVAIGEAEEILPRIVSGEPLENLPSIAYKNDAGKAIINHGTELFRDLDSVPFPAWDLFEYKDFRFSHYRRRPLVSMSTSRGCAFKCIYCSSNIVHKYETRTRSVDNVVDEIQWDVEKFGVREIHVIDDDFTYSVDRVKELCGRIISRGLNKKVILAKPNAIRPDRGDQEMFDLLKKAGFYFVAIAVEAVDPEVSKGLRRGVDLEKQLGTIRMARKSGLFINTFYLMGSPFDTKESMMKNIAFACKAPTDIVAFFALQPYPGTVFHNMMVEQGAIEDMSHGQVPSCNEMSSACEANDWTQKDLKRIIKYGYRKYYLSPFRMLRLAARLPLFISDPITLAKLFFNLLFGGSPAADSIKTRKTIAKKVEKPREE